MSRLPRAAVGTIQENTDPVAMLWALMEVLRQDGLSVQTFQSQAVFPSSRGAACVTGFSPRHLDSWLMSPELCRETFARSARQSDLSLVEGSFGGDGRAGGDLETLCRWLDLPKIVVLDASLLDGECVPDRPKMVKGALLDRVADDRQLARLGTNVEAVWGAPVLGALERIPRLRSEIERVPRGTRPPRALCEQLAERLRPRWRGADFVRIARRRPLTRVASDVFRSRELPVDLTVAVAYDEAFNCYYPDALDLLDLWGASVIDFSPLRDESLPAGTDIVYLGCGHPERYAALLSENHCMKAALRAHVREGRRIYAEGGGLAYLCEQMEVPTGEFRRMVGVFSARARLRRQPKRPTPVEVSLARANWLGDEGSRVRGYRNGRWWLEPAGPLTGFADRAEHRHDLIGCFRAVGSMVHLDFAAQPHLLHRFFFPRTPQPAAPAPWTVVH
jgi:cobyrinic acid a,c-diamide synthase